MVEKQAETFAVRFERLRGGMSLQALSEAIERKAGVQISAQAMHKWTQGGNISPENAKVIAEFFGVTEPYLIYGAGPMSATSLEQAIRSLPAESGQQTLDFVKYQLDRSRELFTNDHFSEYMAMIDRLISDMKSKQKK